MQLEYPQYCQLTAAIVGFATYKQSQQLAFKLLAIFCAVTFINEVAATILWNDYHKSTHWLYYIYFPFRCAFILYFFISAVEQVKAKRQESGTLTLGQETEVPDAHEALRE